MLTEYFPAKPICADLHAPLLMLYFCCLYIMTILVCLRVCCAIVAIVRQSSNKRHHTQHKPIGTKRQSAVILQNTETQRRMGNGLCMVTHLFLFIWKFYLKNLNQGYVFSLLFAALVQPYLVLTLYSQCFGAGCNTSLAEHTTHAVLFQRFVLKVLVSETLLWSHSF